MDEFGQSEIGDQRAIGRLFDHYVVWLHIPMQDALIVRRLESSGNLNHVDCSPSVFQRSIAEQLHETHSSNKPHRIIPKGRTHSVLRRHLADFIDGDDVVVLERCCRVGLRSKSFQRISACRGVDFF